jgi:hypothetical protein
VLPDSPSAKEVNELWIYIQDRLARLVKDPTLAPETRPEYFSISSLSGGLEDVDANDPVSQSDDVSGLSARLRDAYTPPAEEPTAHPTHAALPAPVTTFGVPEPKAPEPVAPSAPEPKPEFGERKVMKPRGPTLFGGAGRQTNTFGRRN